MSNTSMLEIRKALEQEDYCEAMNNLYYRLLLFDEDEYFCIFEDQDKDHLIYFDFDKKEFWTYSRANHGVLSK